MEAETELRGTTACPICGYDEPHSHTASEIAERPYIDGARVAFEKDAHEFMRRDCFKGSRAGFWWAFDAEQARRSDAWENGGERTAHGWSQRDYAWGPYSNEFVEVMWQLWRIAWLSARSAPRKF